LKIDRLKKIELDHVFDLNTDNVELPNIEEEGNNNTERFQSSENKKLEETLKQMES